MYYKPDRPTCGVSNYYDIIMKQTSQQDDCALRNYSFTSTQCYFSFIFVIIHSQVAHQHTVFKVILYLGRGSLKSQDMTVIQCCSDFEGCYKHLRLSLSNVIAQTQIKYLCHLAVWQFVNIMKQSSYSITQILFHSNTLCLIHKWFQSGRLVSALYSS